MKILVLNSGSSSIKYKVFDKANFNELISGTKEEISDHSQAIKDILQILQNKQFISDPKDIFCIGHRVVHGGDLFYQATLITPQVIQSIQELCTLAPLHNKANLLGIKAVAKILPNIAQVAVFDTAFHQTIPNKAAIYPIPYQYTQQFQIKRYGFHGTSHQYVATKAAKQLNKELTQCNFISLHLGNGASICAIQNGKSIDTSMGFTPLEGLMMGTRSGDIDPSIMFYLQNKLQYSTTQIDTLLNKQSGFKGFCGTSDLRKVIQLAQNNDSKALLALDIFVYKIIKYIGSYFIILDNIDALILTGGIGEHSRLIQQKLAQATKKLNLKHLIIPTNEELSIAIQANEVIKG